MVDNSHSARYAQSMLSKIWNDHLLVSGPAGITDDLIEEYERLQAWIYDNAAPTCQKFSRCLMPAGHDGECLDENGLEHPILAP